MDHRSWLIDQNSIPKVEFNYSDTFSIKGIPALVRLFREVKDGYVIDPSCNHRIGLLILDLLKYIQQNDLLEFPATVKCDELLQASFGVWRFQLSQISDIIYMSVPIGIPNQPNQHELYLRSVEKASIMRMVLDLSQEERYQPLL